jgi:hypothetical protein
MCLFLFVCFLLKWPETKLSGFVLRFHLGCYVNNYEMTTIALETGKQFVML